MIERLDVASEDDLDAVVTRMGDTPIDILICNAAVFKMVPQAVMEMKSSKAENLTDMGTHLIYALAIKLLTEEFSRQGQ